MATVVDTSGAGTAGANERPEDRVARGDAGALRELQYRYSRGRIPFMAYAQAIWSFKQKQWRHVPELNLLADELVKHVKNNFKDLHYLGKAERNLVADAVLAVIILFWLRRSGAPEGCCGKGYTDSAKHALSFGMPLAERPEDMLQLMLLDAELMIAFPEPWCGRNQKAAAELLQKAAKVAASISGFQERAVGFWAVSKLMLKNGQRTESVSVSTLALSCVLTECGRVIRSTVDRRAA